MSSKFRSSCLIAVIAVYSILKNVFIKPWNYKMKRVMILWWNWVILKIVNNVFLTCHKTLQDSPTSETSKSVYPSVFILSFFVCKNVQYFFDSSEKSNLKKHSLHMWSFFLPIRVYLSLHFLPIILGNKFLIFLFSVFGVFRLFWIWIQPHITPPGNCFWRFRIAALIEPLFKYKRHLAICDFGLIFYNNFFLYTSYNNVKNQLYFNSSFFTH